MPRTGKLRELIKEYHSASQYAHIPLDKLERAIRRARKEMLYVADFGFIAGVAWPITDLSDTECSLRIQYIYITPKERTIKNLRRLIEAAEKYAETINNEDPNKPIKSITFGFDAYSDITKNMKMARAMRYFGYELAYAEVRKKI